MRRKEDLPNDRVPLRGSGVPVVDETPGCASANNGRLVQTTTRSCPQLQRGSAPIQTKGAATPGSTPNIMFPKMRPFLESACWA